MKFSQFHIPTSKEVPQEATMISHKLLERGGFIKKLSAGIYSFLPLAFKVLKKVEDIIREEMLKAGALEVLLPMVHPAEIWKKSGRWFQYGSELLRFKDRKDAEFCLAPTHEEAVTELVRTTVKSYKKLPLNLFQIQMKFRDEPRPRAGLIRGREFIMKDAYSFDATEDGAKISYQKMYEAYKRIFTRLGFDFRIVEADTGNIGGSMSHEFQALAEAGEDEILICSSCDYAANIEKAGIFKPSETNIPFIKESKIKKVFTPEVKSVEDVANFLKVKKEAIVKTLIYVADSKPVAVLVRGDHELNEIKLKNLLDAETLTMAPEEVINEVTGGPLGFSGPYKLKKKVRILADYGVMDLQDFVIGANEKDHHYVNCNFSVDIPIPEFHDLRIAKDGDPCPVCGKPMKLLRAIELGHVFYLGTKYSKPMKATFLDKDGKERPFIMGCYGIGVSRILPALVEQNNDEKGIIWPIQVAPFEVLVIPLHTEDESINEFSMNLYHNLLQHGIDAAIDDRDERTGFKFNDADLIGIPIQVIIGKKSFKNGEIEIKYRKTMAKEKIRVEGALETIIEIVKKEKNKIKI